MLRPSVLVNVRLHCFYPTLFALVLQIRTRQNEGCRGDPSACFLITLLFAPSLHAIMHIEIIPLFQRHRHGQKDLFHQNSPKGVQQICAYGGP